MNLPVIEAAKKIDLPVELIRAMASHPHVTVRGFNNSGKSLIAAALANFIQGEYGVSDVLYLVDENIDTAEFKRDHRYGLVVYDYGIPSCSVSITGTNAIRTIAMIPTGGSCPDSLSTFIDVFIPPRITPGTIIVYREDKLITCWYQGVSCRMQFSFINPFTLDDAK